MMSSSPPLSPRTASRPGRRAARVGFIARELSRARLTSLVVATTAAGYAVGAEGALAWGRLAWTLIGTALAAGGACAVNQWMERDRDALMTRTASRPLPTGLIRPAQALAAGLIAMGVGIGILAIRVNAPTALLGLVTQAVYLLAYTPLKPRTSFCTMVGAVSGAIPPMMGWTAATGTLAPGAWLLGATLFLWQLPHFLAIGWLHRTDYARAGFRILPVIDRNGGLTFRACLFSAVALAGLGLAAPLFGLAGAAYVIGSVLLGTWLVLRAAAFSRGRTEALAKRVLVAGFLYLPLSLGLMVIDRGASPPGASPPPAASEREAPARPAA